MARRTDAAAHFGPYEPIRRDYSIDEYRSDVAGSNVVGSVYVQTNWARERFEDEAAWVQKIAVETGWPHAIVAYADFSVPDVRPQLDRLKRYHLVRGVRMQLHWHENPLYRFASRADLAVDPTTRLNVGRLAEYGLSFDLQVFAGQMADAADLAEACPKVTFVLQHAGMLEAFRVRGGRNGAPEWCVSRRARTSSPNSRGSAPSCTETILATSPRSCARRSASSARTGACSARTFRSKSCGPRMARWSTPTGMRWVRCRSGSSGRSCTTPP